jgi:hypothetical protein
LGDGASTIDSVFHTNTADAMADLVGEKLDNLVTALREVELIVIDEISSGGCSVRDHESASGAGWEGVVARTLL